ncbi:MAG TPA: cytochrome C [Patescibacteria group bacterium]|nr:cytochrome C [Patescibacteria group bacterium]
MNTKTKAILAVSVVAAAAFGWGCIAATAGAGRAQEAQVAVAPGSASASVARGRYLAKVAGCNDCHTPNYAMTGGDVPESTWLTGDALGWQGPWGTTYAANLRLSLTAWSEDEWVQVAKNTKFRPPMPWFALRDMEETDLRSLYRFVRELGPSGQPAPTYLPPGGEVRGPVVTFPAPPKP